MKRLLTTAAACLAAVSLPASVSALELEAGAVLGGNYSRLSQPRDLEGEPTLLQGSRFTGFGVHVGADARWNVTPLDFADLVIDASLLVAFQNGSGFVEDTQTGARRDVDLSLVNLRLPATIGARYELGESSGLTLELGPELLVGIQSSSTVTEFGIPGDARVLDVTTATRVAFTVGAEFDILVSDAFVVPISVRYAYDPFLPKKTVERFEGFVSEEEPGAFTVAFDHAVLVTVGARFEL